MLRKSIETTNPSKEKGDGSKESQVTSDQFTSLDMTKEASWELEVKPFPDKALQSDVGSSSNLSKNIEIPANFQQIGGNTELAKAQVILLGEAHVPQHHKDIMGFINAHAKKGDIVLVEGTQAGQEQDKLHEELGKAIDFGYLTVDEVASYYTLKVINNKTFKKGYSKLIEQNIVVPLKKHIKIYGWDDMDALDKQRKILFNVEKIPLNPEDNRLSKLREDFVKIHYQLDAERDKKMLETIENMRTSFSDKKLFIVAGALHISNIIGQENLKNKPYIALLPKHEITEKDAENYIRIINEEKRK